ncbi:MAG TPA: AbrB/MazE/SpoVT family DNA-binding domain-containing protein [Candidatus Hydrogenedentes bacterium]|nr:AbrB/MazE/SpoVT family DNA-binding domain-containing protein [Candidatus Hydrogenedentota bacterium]
MKTLTRHGNSLALIIDKPILDLLKIDANTPLDLSTDGDVLIVRPERDAKRAEAIRSINDQLHTRYAKTFRRLAE